VWQGKVLWWQRQYNPIKVNRLWCKPIILLSFDVRASFDSPNWAQDNELPLHWGYISDFTSWQYNFCLLQ